MYNYTRERLACQSTHPQSLVSIALTVATSTVVEHPGAYADVQRTFILPRPLPRQVSSSQPLSVLEGTSLRSIIDGSMNDTIMQSPDLERYSMECHFVALCRISNSRVHMTGGIRVSNVQLRNTLWVVGKVGPTNERVYEYIQKGVYRGRPRQRYLSLP